MAIYKPGKILRATYIAELEIANSTLTAPATPPWYEQMERAD